MSDALAEDLEQETTLAEQRRSRRGSVPPPQWEQAKVVEIIDEAPDTVTLRMSLSSPGGFLPGQYYNVRMPIPDRPRPVQRAYSVGSSPVPDPAVIDIGVREVIDGLVSPRLVRVVKVGDELEVRGPYGKFVWNEADGGPVLLVGAGSGLVPLVAIIRYNAAIGAGVRMRMVCSAMNFDHSLYRQDLADLAAEHEWLDVIHSFTRDPDDPRANYHRRIDKPMLAEAIADLQPKLAYLCGPPAMVETAAESLVELGMDPELVLTEKYD